MKTVICAINSKYIHASPAADALLAGVSFYSKRNPQLEIVETTIHMRDDKILEKIAECEPDIVAFSCYIWNISTVLRLISRLNKPVLLGGPEAAFRAEEFMGLEPVIAVFTGEGEYSFAKALDCIVEGEDFSSVPGVYYKRGGIVYSNPPEVCKEPPSSCTDAYLSRLKGRISYIEASRGCPFSCAFCLSGKNDPVRFFDFERVKQDILRLARAGGKTIKFVDRTFNCNALRAREILSFIINGYGTDIPTDVCFHFEVAADLFGKETLALLKTAPKGLIQMEAGLQSFHEETLAAVTRKTDLNKLCENVRAILNAGNVHLHIDLIAGLPFEDMDCFGRSFDRAFSLRPHMLQLGFLKLLHGSKLRADASQYGYVWAEDPPYEIMTSKWITQEELAQLSRAEDVLERMYNSGRFRLTVEELLRRTGLSPFALFIKLGGALSVSCVALDEYTDLLKKAIERLFGLDLRDVLVLDRLSSSNTGKIPHCLQVKDDRLKSIRRSVVDSGEFGVNPGVAILYEKPEQVVAADYSKKDAVTGLYPLKTFPIGQFHT